MKYKDIKMACEAYNVLRVLEGWYSNATWRGIEKFILYEYNVTMGWEYIGSTRYSWIKIGKEKTLVRQA